MSSRRPLRPARPVQRRRAAGAAAGQVRPSSRRIIVKVNGEIFTQTRARAAADRGAARAEQRRSRAARTSQTTPDVRKALLEITPAILVEAVDELLLVQRGRELGHQVHRRDVQAERSTTSRSRTSSTTTRLERACKQAGLTLRAAARRTSRRAYFMTSVQQQEITRNMTLTEEEARQYYKAHPDEFMKPRDRDAARDSGVGADADGTGGQATFNVAIATTRPRRRSTASARGAERRGLRRSSSRKLSESGTKANGGLIGPVVVDELQSGAARRARQAASRARSPSRCDRAPATRSSSSKRASAPKPRAVREGPRRRSRRRSTRRACDGETDEVPRRNCARRR